MITKLHIDNFKSLRHADLDLGKITILTGANNSGKSSFIYSILALKNTVSNPNQSIDNCLTLPFINLGGFKETVYLKNEAQNINIGITIKEENIEVDYTISLGKKRSSLNLVSKKPIALSVELEVAFPYPVNKNENYSFEDNFVHANFTWNGISINFNGVSAGGFFDPNESLDSLIEDVKGNIQKIFQLPINTFPIIDFVPIRRGFTKPYFSPVPLQSQITTEDELATLLANDRDLAGQVAHYLEKIVERSFSVYTTPGTANFYLQTRDKKNGFTSDLVNEGLGTNQLVTILAKVLQRNNKFVCIDEPEIHLHPTIINKLVSVLIEIADSEEKQFLISTHSEHFINAILNSVVKKEISYEDIKVYYLNKEKKETKIEQQAINESGQIEGGLKNFYASELDDLKTFFKITE